MAGLLVSGALPLGATERSQALGLVQRILLLGLGCKPDLLGASGKATAAEPRAVHQRGGTNGSRAGQRPQAAKDGPRKAKSSTQNRPASGGTSEGEIVSLKAAHLLDLYADLLEVYSRHRKVLAGTRAALVRAGGHVQGGADRLLDEAGRGRCLGGGVVLWNGLLDSGPANLNDRRSDLSGDD